MWVWATIGSALLLGLYDVAKKQSLKNNDVLYILFFSTLFSTLFLSPFFSAGSASDYLALMAKAFIVTTSWISGLYALKYLPLTTASTLKATRPVFVYMFSIILFHEKLNMPQWIGSIIVLSSIFMLSRSSKKEGIAFSANKGLAFMAVSILSGVASALYDKHIISYLEPLFVQSWGNLYITLLLGACILFMRKFGKEEVHTFKWDWMLLIIALCITAADFLYFYALNEEGALLAIISMIRRTSVLVPFLFGAFLFKEKNIRGKSAALAVLLTGMAIIVWGSV